MSAQKLKESTVVICNPRLSFSPLGSVSLGGPNDTYSPYITSPKSSADCLPKVLTGPDCSMASALWLSPCRISGEGMRRESEEMQRRDFDWDEFLEEHWWHWWHEAELESETVTTVWGDPTPAQPSGMVLLREVSACFTCVKSLRKA